MLTQTASANVETRRESNAIIDASPVGKGNARAKSATIAASRTPRPPGVMKLTKPMSQAIAYMPMHIGQATNGAAGQSAGNSIQKAVPATIQLTHHARVMNKI